MIEVCEGMHVRETQRETLPRFLLCSSIRERKKKKTGNVLEGEKREEKEKLSLSLDASPPSVDSKPFSSLSKRFDNDHPPSPPSFFPFPSSSLLSLTHTRNGRRPQSPRLRRHPRQHRRLGRGAGGARDAGGLEVVDGLLDLAEVGLFEMVERVVFLGVFGSRRGVEVVSDERERKEKRERERKERRKEKTSFCSPRARPCSGRGWPRGRPSA